MTTPFWSLETREELECVNALLERSFPRTMSLLREALQDADPLDIVYVGNPGEYADVVREAVALLSWQRGDPRRLDANALKETLLEALRRCFDEEPDPARVASAVRLIREALRSW